MDDSQTSKSLESVDNNPAMENAYLEIDKEEEVDVSFAQLKKIEALLEQPYMQNSPSR